MERPKKQEIYAPEDVRIPRRLGSGGVLNMGFIVPASFTGYEDLYERFEREWQQIAMQFVDGEQI